uniref:Si:ch211-15d5.11 n=1 Tax=Gasterosteus aculeatus aculeatus TaxID=481459 RepID=A0AAQ4S512_GASAC
MGKQSLLQRLYNKHSRRNEHSDVYLKGLSGDTVFSVSSQFSSHSPSSGGDGNIAPSNCSSDSPSSSAPRPPRKGKSPSAGPVSSQQGLDCKAKRQADPESLETLAAQTQPPSPEAEYDKLLDVEAVPMPDGQLCLLALPPECCQGEGPGSMRYLKLFCRYITDRKGVVSGILLVTSNKIFFDPCKTHALVKEHGCEEYLLSCSVDSLASVAFFSDISHVRFNTSQQRKKGKKNVQNLNTAKRPAGGFPNPKGESLPARVSVASSDLSHLALCRTKEVCGEKEKEAESVDVSAAEVELDSGPPEVLPEASAGDLGASAPSGAATSSFGDREAETSSGKSWTAVPWSSSAGNAGGLMFLRLRVQPSVGKTKGAGGLQMGASKPIHRKDAWLALSQERFVYTGGRRGREGGGPGRRGVCSH